MRTRKVSLKSDFIHNFLGIQFIETSALDSSNVEKAFFKVVSDIYQQHVTESQ